jgi:hypothetical protein
MVRPGKGREEYERKQLARNRKRRILDKREKLGTSHPSTHEIGTSLGEEEKYLKLCCGHFRSYAL